MNIGYFDHQQEKFDQLVAKTHNKIGALNLISGITNQARWYLLTIVPCQNSSYQFSARFEENKNPEREDLKTSIHRKIDKGRNKKVLLDIISDNEDDYATVCAKWIIEFLFTRQYEYRYVDMILPPKYTRVSDQSFQSNINTLDLRVSSEETDPQLVDWWLSRFSNPVNYLRIYANELRMNIANNATLHGCSKIELFGNCDLNLDCIKAFRGKCLFYKEVHPSWSISDYDLKRLFIHMNEDIHETKCVFLKWTLPSEKSELEKFVRHRYYDHFHERGNFLRKNGDCLFHFRMEETKTIVGNFPMLYYSDAEDALEFEGII